MRNIQDSYYSSYRDRNRGKRKLLLYVLAFICIGLIVGGILGWYFSKRNKDEIINPDNSPFNCTDIPDEKKFDCYPGAPITESECINLGCCFSKPKKLFLSSLPSLNVPYCYYPSNFDGYIIKELEQNSRRIKIKLLLRRNSGFHHDIFKVNVLVSFIDDYNLRIKITDSDSERFEVPTQLHYQTKELFKPLYHVKVNTDSGLLTVSRKNTSSIIFQTNLQRLVFSDQFLQLSSDLPSTYIYGIGEHYNGVLRSVDWTRLTLFNSDLSPTPNHALYGSHPFYIALENDGKASGVFLFNSNIMDVILQPAPAVTFRPIGGIFDFFIMLGPSPNDVTRQYSNLVGKTFMPPYWSLGFQLCRYGYNSLEKTNETMTRTINAGIPLDVQWNDIDYMDLYKDFTYDKVKFKDLPKFVDELHSKGMHYVLMIDPGISNSEQKPYPPYDEGVDDDIFVKNASGSIFTGKVWSGTQVYPDFSHPAATNYWTRQFRRLYNDIKFDGVWIDMNEPSDFYDGEKDGCPDSPFETPQYLPGGNKLSHKTLCMTAKHYYTTHYNEHNLYAYREAMATNKAIRSVVKKRPFIISRASFAGQGVYSGHWSGDVFSTWEDLRYSIRSLINFNMYAMPMIGSDICGFGGNTTTELCARWQTLGAFYPFSRNHNDKTTKEQDPVALGPTVVQATRTALQKRYTLLPYLYTLFYRSHVFGDTVIRPLIFEFPEDKNTSAIDEQFLWGSSLMIVPVLYPNTSTVNAYFPKGLWYDAVTSEPRKSAGEKFSLTIPDIDIHLSVRGGYIFPAQSPALTTTAARKNPFAIAVVLDEELKASGELYWDDGESLETYQNGIYNLIQFQAFNGTFRNTVINRGYQSAMNMESITILGVDVISNVSVNGENCTYVDIDPPSNSTLSSDNKNENSYVENPGLFGISLVKNMNNNTLDTFCQFTKLGNMFLIKTKPVSLLSPNIVTWE